MTKKERLLERYLETHTLADYEAYAACPEGVEEEPVRRGLKESDDEPSAKSRSKRG